MIRVKEFRDRRVEEKWEKGKLIAWRKIYYLPFTVDNLGTTFGWLCPISRSPVISYYAREYFGRFRMTKSIFSFKP
jgi:hypothetical protein